MWPANFSNLWSFFLMQFSNKFWDVPSIKCILCWYINYSLNLLSNLRIFRFSVNNIGFDFRLKTPRYVRIGWFSIYVLDSFFSPPFNQDLNRYSFALKSKGKTITILSYVWHANPAKSIAHCALNNGLYRKIELNLTPGSLDAPFNASLILCNSIWRINKVVCDYNQ